MKILSFFLLLKIVSPSAGELLTGNDDISNESLLLNKRALPSEFDKEPKFKWSPDIQGPSGVTLWPILDLLNNILIEFFECIKCNYEGCCWSTWCQWRWRWYAQARGSPHSTESRFNKFFVFCLVLINFCSIKCECTTVESFLDSHNLWTRLL